MSRGSKSDATPRVGTRRKSIDVSDIPELDETFFREAEWRPPIKKSVTIRLDADVLDWFRRQGKGYQTRINQLLRRYMEVQRRRP